MNRQPSESIRALHQNPKRSTRALCAAFVALSCLVMSCDDDSSTTVDTTQDTTRTDTAGDSASADIRTDTTVPPDTIEDTAGDLDAVQPSPFEHALEAIGGEQALTAATHIRIAASGSRWIDYEGMEPSDLHDASTYTSTYLHDLASGDLRVDMTRTPLFEAFQFFPAEEYSVVVNDDVGGLTAQAGFYPPGAMPSQHVGALSQQQRLFNPHLLLRAGVTDSTVVGDGGDATFEGRDHRILTITDLGVEVRLFVDSQSGTISKLETMENSPLFRDVPIEVHYLDWEMQGTLMFPTTVELHAVEGLVQSEERSSIEVDPVDVAIDAFDFPPEAGTPQVDPDAHEFGRHSHQVVEAFFHILFGYDTGGTVQATELAPGVVLLAAGHNSVAVQVDGDVIVLEGPISPGHGTAVVDAIATEFPGAPISHVIQSHHHQDHSAGVRSLAAAGATVVVGAGVGSFFEAVLAAPSSLRPDALSQVDVTTTVEEITANGNAAFTGANITVTAHHMPANPHAADMVITLVDTGNERFVYVADLYNAGAGFTVVVGGPESFMATLRDLGIIDASCASAVPLTIIPAHGIPQSLQDSITEMVGLGLDIGCP